MTKLTADSYEELIRRSGLVEPKQLERVLNQLREEYPDNSFGSETLAEKLIEAGYLTQWQNEMIVEDRQEALLDGRHKGFFLGSYKLLKHLGTGGMSSVYLAEHIVMRRRVAIKVLPISGEEDQEFLERFRLESRAIAALDHPNIVRAHDFSNDGQIYYLVMEYIEGMDLERRVEEMGPMPFRKAAEFIRQACEGLGHAHQEGLIHRDIKPANLLVDRKNTVKILDLGIARLEDPDEVGGEEEEDSGAIIGTVEFLAPEQALDAENVDVRADIYSLGCTLYYLLTGHPPFAKGSMAQKIMAHQTEEPPPISNDRPDAPPGLVRIIGKMMAKQPKDRYLSTKQVQMALQDWLDNGDQEPANPVAAAPMDAKVICTQCGSDYGRYMYRNCPKCGAANPYSSPQEEPPAPEPEPEPQQAFSRVEDVEPGTPVIKASCPSCGAKYTARWSTCLECGSIMHRSPVPEGETMATSHPQELTPDIRQTYYESEEEAAPAYSEADYYQQQYDQQQGHYEQDPYQDQYQQGYEQQEHYEQEYQEQDYDQEQYAESNSGHGMAVEREPTPFDPPETQAQELEPSASAAVEEPEPPVRKPRGKRGKTSSQKSGGNTGSLIRLAGIVASLVVVVGLLIGGLAIVLKGGTRVQEIYPDGSKRAEGAKVDNQPHGPWTYWYKNGQKDEAGTYVQGEKDGPWTYWNEEGQIVERGPYLNGQRHGQWEFRYEDTGQLKETGKFVQGQKDGLWTYWHETGHEYKQEKYNNGQLIETKILEDKQGDPITAPELTTPDKESAD